MVRAGRLRWRSTVGWSDSACPLPEAALVVDSFLASEGGVRDLAEHEDRFRRGCRVLDLPVAGLDGFLAAARAELPPRGRWFPRFEAHADGALVFWVREAPAQGREVRLWNPQAPDPRRHPTVKGPDLALLADLRKQAAEWDADDALLTGAGGVVLEASHSALLWWRGEGLEVPDPALPLLPSVTARRLLRMARAGSVPVTARRCRPDELAGTEVWTVNALHGIRPVVGWRCGGPSLAEPDRARLERFRAHLALPGAPARHRPCR
ncbi:aminotransferase class IV [Pseudonocardia xishanensis]|uniref:Aminotransferase class IV n=1 Tax=Pseudonocardia xishanensis TaxID=630995 RepID=A0ABP8RZY7_9PSEU